MSPLFHNNLQPFDVSRLVRQAFDLVFPPCCLVCQLPTAGALVCYRCRPDPYKHESRRCIICATEMPAGCDDRVCTLCRIMPPVIRRLRYLWNYGRKERDLIHAMKYRPSPKLCGILGTLLGESFPHLFTYQDWTTIVPLPSSTKSLRQRGFNQCALLAEALYAQLPHNKQCRMRLSFNALEHIGAATPQAQLSHSKRIANVKNCFRANPRQVAGKVILLLDDVITTGATTAAATVALLQAGALAVDVLALCRSPAWHEYRDAIARSFRLGVI